jgi:hypothetical protein
MSVVSFILPRKVSYNHEAHGRRGVVERPLLLRDRIGALRGGALVDVAGFKADVKEMPGHGFFAYFFISVAQAGQTDKVAVFDLFNDLNVLYPAGPALYAVTFHQSSGPLWNYLVSNIGFYNTALEVFMAVF